MGITIIGWLIGIIIGFGGVVIVKRIINANVELGIIIAMITLGLIFQNNHSNQLVVFGISICHI